MNETDKIVDLVYTAYERYTKAVDIPDEYEEKWKKLAGLLDKEQLDALYEYHFAEIDFGILRQKNVIKFVVELLIPES